MLETKNCNQITTIQNHRWRFESGYFDIQKSIVGYRVIRRELYHGQILKDSLWKDTDETTCVQYTVCWFLSKKLTIKALQMLISLYVQSEPVFARYSTNIIDAVQSYRIAKEWIVKQIVRYESIHYEY